MGRTLTTNPHDKGEEKTRKYNQRKTWLGRYKEPSYYLGIGEKVPVPVGYQEGGFQSGERG